MQYEENKALPHVVPAKEPVNLFEGGACGDG
jgi:hypothetical protein